MQSGCFGEWKSAGRVTRALVLHVDASGMPTEWVHLDGRLEKQSDGKGVCTVYLPAPWTTADKVVASTCSALWWLRLGTLPAGAERAVHVGPTLVAVFWPFGDSFWACIWCIPASATDFPCSLARVSERVHALETKVAVRLASEAPGAIRRHRPSAGSTTSLTDYQEETVRWMQERECADTPAFDVWKPPREQWVCTTDGRWCSAPVTLWVDSQAGLLCFQPGKYTCRSAPGASEWGKGPRGGLVLYGQGLGKTVVGAALLGRVLGSTPCEASSLAPRALEGVASTLILAPHEKLDAWIAHLRLFAPCARVLIYHTTARGDRLALDRRLVRLQALTVVLTSHQTFASLQSQRTLTSKRWARVLVDDATRRWGPLSGALRRLEYQRLWLLGTSSNSASELACMDMLGNWRAVVSSGQSLSDSVVRSCVRRVHTAPRARLTLIPMHLTVSSVEEKHELERQRRRLSRHIQSLSLGVAQETERQENALYRAAWLQLESVLQAHTYTSWKVPCPPPVSVHRSTEDCSVCCDRFRDPVQLDCRHVFCRVCLCLSVQSKRACPLCRTALAAHRALRNNDDDDADANDGRELLLCADQSFSVSLPRFLDDPLPVHAPGTRLSVHTKLLAVVRFLQNKYGLGGAEQASPTLVLVWNDHFSGALGFLMSQAKLESLLQSGVVRIQTWEKLFLRSQRTCFATDVLCVDTPPLVRAHSAVVGPPAIDDEEEDEKTVEDSREGPRLVNSIQTEWLTCLQRVVAPAHRRPQDQVRVHQMLLADTSLDTALWCYTDRWMRPCTTPTERCKLLWALLA